MITKEVIKMDVEEGKGGCCCLWNGESGIRGHGYFVLHLFARLERMNDFALVNM